MFKDTRKANTLVSMNQMTGMRYDFEFADEDLSRSKIDIFGRGPSGSATWDLIQLGTTARAPHTNGTAMELNEVKEPPFDTQPPGEAWFRRTYIDDPLNPDIKFNEYKWFRIMDGDMNVRRDRFQDMVNHFNKINLTRIMHYWDEC